MKIFIMITILFLLPMIKLQAATVVLKNGQTITGDISKKDADKTIIKVDGVDVTYYKDEIASIDENSAPSPAIQPEQAPSVQPDQGSPVGLDQGSSVQQDQVPDIAPDPEKEELADQILENFPTEDRKTEWVQTEIPDNKRAGFLSFLQENSYGQKTLTIRKRILLKTMSLADLKILASLISSSEGMAFCNDLLLFQKSVKPLLFQEQEAEKKAYEKK